MHLCFEWELQRLWRDCSNVHTRLSFCCLHMQSIDCVSKLSLTSKCTYVFNGGGKGSGQTAQMPRLVWAFRVLVHTIKTTVDCVSMSSKCTYVLNVNIHRCSFFPELLNFGTISHLTFVIVLTSDHSEQVSLKLIKKLTKNSSSSNSPISTSLNIFITHYIITIHDAFHLFFHTCWFHSSKTRK